MNECMYIYIYISLYRYSCVQTEYNILYKSVTTQRDGVCKKKKNLRYIQICTSSDQEKKKRDFHTRPENVKQKHQNGAKGPPNFPHDCKFCKLFEGVSEDSMMRRMPCKQWCHENCAGEQKRHYFGSTASELVMLFVLFCILPKQQVSKLIHMKVQRHLLAT